MNFIYVIFIIVVLVIVGFKIFVNRMMKESPYYHTKRILEDKLSSLEESDWKSKQEVNLKLCWINSLKSFELSTTLGDNKEEIVKNTLNNLTNEEIQFPKELDLNEYSHFNFTHEIVTEFKKVVEDCGYEFMKPYKILPYPFDYIDKSFVFLIRFVKKDDEIFSSEDKETILDELDRVSCNLFLFIDTGNDDISKDRSTSIRDSIKYKY